MVRSLLAETWRVKLLSGDFCSFNSDIDLVSYGRLIQSVDNLTAAVDKLNGRITVLESDLTRGKGVLVGVIVAASALSVGLVKTIEKLL